MIELTGLKKVRERTKELELQKAHLPLPISPALGDVRDRREYELLKGIEQQSQSDLRLILETLKQSGVAHRPPIKALIAAIDSALKGEGSE